MPQDSAEPVVARTLDRRMRTFLVVWFGQFISLLGTGLTGFALGVWVYQRSGSATQFTLMILSATLPGILLTPLAGVLADRWNRRGLMLVSDIGAGICTLLTAALIIFGGIQLWHVYLITVVRSVFGSLRWPAFAASISVLVPHQHLSRANGLLQLGEGLSQIIAPIIAGVLVTTIGLYGVLLIDTVTFLFATVTLLLVRFPGHLAATATKEQRPFWRDMVFGWDYIRARPGLFALLAVFVCTNFTLGMVEVLLAPLVLTFASTAVLGVVQTTAGTGMLLGSILIGTWGGPRRRVYGIIGFLLVQGLLLFLGGLRPNGWLVSVATFVYMFSLAMIIGLSQPIWQTKVEQAVQGRVFATRFVVSQLSVPLAYLFAGPLADYVFEPWLAPGGKLADSVGRLIGVGPGRGIGFLFMILGVLTVLVTLGGLLNPRVRRLEQELPDTTLPNEPAAPLSQAQAEPRTS
jgi:MFS transporter, DHA3 family, macrolide efflux protein